MAKQNRGQALPARKNSPAESLLGPPGKRLAEPCVKDYLPPPELPELPEPPPEPPLLEPPLLEPDDPPELPPLEPPLTPLPVEPPLEVPLKLPVASLGAPFPLLLVLPVAVEPFPSGPPPLPSPVRPVLALPLEDVPLPLALELELAEPLAVTLPSGFVVTLMSELLPRVPLIVRGAPSSPLNGSRRSGSNGRPSCPNPGRVVGGAFRPVGFVVGSRPGTVTVSLGFVVGFVVAAGAPFGPETGCCVGGGWTTILPLRELPPPEALLFPELPLFVWPLLCAYSCGSLATRAIPPMASDASVKNRMFFCMM